MKLEVRHRTHYRYAHAVSFSQHVLRLEPRPSRRQRVLQHTLKINPEPTRLSSQSDFFENRVSLMTLVAPHESLDVEAQSEVETEPALVTPGDISSMWEDVREACRSVETSTALDASRFCFASRHTRADDAIAEYAAEMLTPGRPILDASLALCHRIHQDFTYAPGTTSATTAVTEAFANRHGVCQDFAHIMLACLRSRHLPARYVSGYLLTRPPEGSPRLIGADASHAWVSIWTPEHDWVDIDPTNDLLPGEGHVAVAWGRDFSDVSPMAGVMTGGGEHSLDVAVDVTPLD